MYKYSDLQEEYSNTFVGEKYADQCSDFVLTDEGTVIIQGFPACPECGTILTHLFLLGKWVCAGCETEWDECSLVEALQNEGAVAKLYTEEDI